MKFLHYIFEVPIIIIAGWGIYNTQIIDNKLTLYLWPLEADVYVKTPLLLFAVLLYGYIWGKINAWFKYSPLRRDLRMQKKANKALNKEHEKLNETVSDLKQNLAGLQGQTNKANSQLSVFKSFTEKMKSKFSSTNN